LHALFVLPFFHTVLGSTSVQTKRENTFSM
jgi:hypothetical protein